MMYKVVYREIETNFRTEKFEMDGINMSIDWQNVRIGQIVQIAEKGSVRPSSVKSPITRLYGVYSQLVVLASSECCDVEDPIEPGSTICPKCAQSWCWDYVVRSHPSWVEHGTYESYSRFGCRCRECRRANALYTYAKSK